ncbi:hypothetical protein FACS1894132_14230 [Clostridia bacterium]|nr:hypothetical protein FACS1894132_14230 [Clostridia bacterium]
MFNRNKRISQSRAVFIMTLEHKVTEDYEETDYQGKRTKQQRTYDNLSPDGHFWVRYRKRHDKSDNDGGASYSDVRDFVERVINEEIVGELREIIDIPIK